MPEDLSHGSNSGKPEDNALSRMHPMPDLCEDLSSEGDYFSGLSFFGRRIFKSRFLSKRIYLFSGWRTGSWVSGNADSFCS
jgi:hypothetical protein